MVTGIILCCMAALLPALLLFFPNMGEILLGDMLPYFGIMLGIGILAWAGMYLVFRRKGLASVTAAVWLLVVPRVGLSFLPFCDQGEIRIKFEFPTHYNLAATERLIREALKNYGR